MRAALQDTLGNALRRMDEIDELNQLMERPAELTQPCLTESRCLEGIAVESRSRGLIAGAVSAVPGGYDMYLVYYDRGIVVRRAVGTVPEGSEAMNASLVRMASELITGDPGAYDHLIRGRKRSQDVAKAQKPAKPPKAPTPPKETPPPKAKAERSSTTSTASATTIRRSGGDGLFNTIRRRSSFTGRAGYAGYYDLEFLTLGVEGRYLVGDHVKILVGAELFVVNRVVPPREEDDDPRRRLNAMTPLNAGAVYTVKLGPLGPYLGGDAIAVKYSGSRPAWAVGVRARAGSDIKLTDSLALNLNGALGVWGGTRWDRVQEGVKAVGLLPQLSGGVVYQF